MAAGVRSPAGWSLEISSSRMNFRRSTSASTSPTASGVSRPFWSTAAARSTRYAPPWPCMRSQSVPISDRYQCRNGQKVTDWRASARRSDGVVCQGLARPKADEDREDKRQGCRDDEARADTGGRRHDSTEQRPKPEAERDGARPDAKDGRLHHRRRLKPDHRPEGRDQRAAEKAGDHEGGDQEGGGGGSCRAEQRQPQQHGAGDQQPPVGGAPQQPMIRERGERRRDTGGSEGDAGPELSLPGAHQLQQAEDHQLVSRSLAWP